MKLYNVTSVKDFMNLLFFSAVFDGYGLCEAEIVTDCSLKVDGRRCAAFYDTDENEGRELPGFLLWGEKKGLIFEAIKGKKLPVRMKMVLKTPADEGQGNVAADPGTGFYLNVRFESGKLNLTTGTSGGDPFAANEAAKEWDAAARSLLLEHGIELGE